MDDPETRLITGELMTDERETSRANRETRKQRGNQAQEIVRIAEAGQGTRLKVVPGRRWALHFPNNARTRNEKLAALMAGEINSAEDGAELRPDALIYATGDADRVGIETVIGQVRDVTTQTEHYDYGQLAHFVHTYRASGLDAEQLVDTYDQIAKVRIQQRLFETLGYTGRQQLERAIQAELAQTDRDFAARSKAGRVFSALKSAWFARNAQTISAETHAPLAEQLTASERQLFEQMQDAYQTYIRVGRQEQFDHFLDSFRPLLAPGNEPQPDATSPNDETAEAVSPSQAPQEPAREPAEDEGLSESGQQLKDDLGDLLNQVVPSGQPGDPAIAPEDKDEYLTSEPEAGYEQEAGRQNPVFTIEPAGDSLRPLTGYFINGRKSYFDSQRLVWSKRKQLTTFLTPAASQERQRLSGWVPARIVSLPIPNGYSLDGLSLRGEGRLKRDQNGCFYIESPKQQSISVEFVREKPAFVGPPVPEDTSPLTSTPVSPAAQQVLAEAQGSAIDRALAICAYVRSAHFYPGGGDLKMAQALQHKLRKGSDADTYIANLEASEYLECYSANTLFAHLVRLNGIPARLVFGHHIEQARDGKAVIDDTTGHAWTEIWDGAEWRRLDATPAPKPGERPPKDQQNSDEAGPQPSPGDAATDGGLESPKTDAERGQSQQNEPGQPQQTQSAAGESSDGPPAQQPPNGQPSPDSGGQLGQSSQSQTSEQSLDTGQANERQSTTSPGEHGPSTPGQQIASDDELAEGQQQLQQSQELVDQMQSQKQSLQDRLQQSQRFEQLEQLKQEAEESDLSDSLTEQLKDLAEAKAEQMKKELEEKLNEMADDGFVDEATRDQLGGKIEEGTARELDQIMQEIADENRVYDRYERIRDEVRPEVEKWFEYFAERLPRQEEIDVDTDSRSRQGSFDRRSVMRARNLLYGTVKNPRVFHQSVEPKFLASIVLDVSGSMQGTKLENATRLLVFYNELFARIGDEFGYIRSAITTFSDSITDVKAFDQDYSSPQRYQFLDGSQSTVKVRLMKSVEAHGGTNMLAAVQAASRQLTDETRDYPDYASAMYFIGDGEDTCGNTANVREFLKTTDEEQGFGHHLLSAIFLGNERQRSTLADIFGDDKTVVAPDLESLIEQSMLKFDDDLEEYLRNKTS